MALFSERVLVKNDSNSRKNISQENIRRYNTDKIIGIRNISQKGRGVVAQKTISKQTLIESAPSSSFPAEQWSSIKRTDVFKYCFVIPSEYQVKPEAKGYVVFGISSFCNHSDNPNAYIEWVQDDTSLWANLIALKDIQADEEIVIRYTNIDEYSAAGNFV